MLVLLKGQLVKLGPLAEKQKKWLGWGNRTGWRGGNGGGVGVLRCYKLLKLFYALKRFSSHLELPVEHWCPVADIKYLFLSG